MRVLVVDDSALIRSMLKEIIHSSMPGWEVAGEARNGQVGVEMNAVLSPDLVICDLEMPIMDGLEATRRMMETKPVPIIIFSSKVENFDAFEAIRSGAVDVIRKPQMVAFNDSDFISYFKDRMVIASGVDVRRSDADDDEAVPVEDARGGVSLVVVGASTGGPKAVAKLLAGIPGDFPAGMLLVQHLEDGFDESFSSWLDKQTPLKVRLAVSGDLPMPGECLVAPVGRHLKISGGSCVLDDGPKVLNQKPSVDVLFTSAAAERGGSLLAVLLTGMGSDGAAGCGAVLNCGGRTLVQDEASCVVYGMPKAAIDAGFASEVVGLSKMAGRIRVLVGGR